MNLTSYQSGKMKPNGNRRSKAISKVDALSASAPIFVILQAVRFIPDDRGVYVVLTLLSIFLGVLFLILAALWCPLKRSASGLLLFSVFLLVANAMLSPSGQLDGLLHYVSHFGFAYAFVCSGAGHSLIKTTSALLIVSFCSLALLGVNPEGIFTISRNYVSVLVVLSISLYLLACDANRRNPSVILLVAAFAVMLWAIGRAGILSGALFLIGCVVVSRANISRLLMLSLIASLVAVSGLFALDFIENFLVGIERFERLSVEGQRQHINREYLLAIQSRSYDLLFGADLAKIASIAEVNGNPHNSVINMHINFGLIGVVFFAALLLFAFVKSSISRSFYISVALFVCLFRSFFDTAAFAGQLDVAILACLIWWLIEQKPRENACVKTNV